MWNMNKCVTETDHVWTRSAHDSLSLITMPTCWAIFVWLFKSVCLSAMDAKLCASSLMNM